MIKLAAMLLFAAVGAVTGVLFFKLTSRLTGQQRLTLPLCIGLGIIGAFGGLLIADLADIRLFGNLIDGLIFSSTGAALLPAINLLVRSKD